MPTRPMKPISTVRWLADPLGVELAAEPLAVAEELGEAALAAATIPPWICAGTTTVVFEAAALAVNPVRLFPDAGGLITPTIPFVQWWIPSTV